MSRSSALAVVFLLGGILTAGAVNAEDCLLPIHQDTLREVTVDGRTFLAAPKEYVDQLECIDTDADAAAAATIQALQRQVAEYRALSDDLAAKLERYSQLIQRMEDNFQSSVGLVDKYEAQVAEYDDLAGRYQKVVADYDELAGKYRDIALDASPGLRFDVGVGANTDGEVAGLVGVGYSRVKLWGLVQERNSALLLGTTLPF